MALDLDIRTVEILSEYFGGRPDVANITLRQAIELYTEEKLKEACEHAATESPFYREKFRDCSKDVNDFEKLPFTVDGELVSREKEFICTDNADRNCIGFASAGTTGRTKNILLTEDERRRNTGFFTCGMRLIVDETDKVLILLPNGTEKARTENAGSLIVDGLKSIGAEVIEYGTPFKDTEKNNFSEALEILKMIDNEKITSVIAKPTHMVALARAATKNNIEIYLRSIVLSGDFVPDKTAIMLEDVFQAMIFEHYGMAETGFSSAISCGYGRGCHVNETDIYIELINPRTGERVPEESNSNTPGFSNYGEIVITTLNRKSMPLIRYRTGDYSRWVLQDCPCGSSLKRLDKIVPGDERREEK